MTLATWFAFLLASTVLLLIPGPTVLLVVSYALTQGRRVAVAMAAGVALGDFTAMTLSLAGLGALLLASASLFTALKMDWCSLPRLSRYQAVARQAGIARCEGGNLARRAQHLPPFLHCDRA
jgi:hypothetical protein